MSDKIAAAQWTDKRTDSTASAGGDNDDIQVKVPTILCNLLRTAIQYHGSCRLAYTTLTLINIGYQRQMKDNYVSKSYVDL